MHMVRVSHMYVLTCTMSIMPHAALCTCITWMCGGLYLSRLPSYMLCVKHIKHTVCEFRNGSWSHTFGSSTVYFRGTRAMTSPA